MYEVIRFDQHGKNGRTLKNHRLLERAEMNAQLTSNAYQCPVDVRHGGKVVMAFDKGNRVNIGTGLVVVGEGDGGEVGDRWDGLG